MIGASDMHRMHFNRLLLTLCHETWIHFAASTTWNPSFSDDASPADLYSRSCLLWTSPKISSISSSDFPATGCEHTPKVP